MNSLNYFELNVIEVVLEMGANCNFCNVGAGHKALKYNI